jgi:ribosomal-protein-alanine N-acetyltransferase
LDDVPALFDILRREDVNEWLETEPMRPIEETAARIKGRANLIKDKMGLRWAITLREDPARVIGSCGYFSVRRGMQTVETGYELHPDHWNKGYMTEALRAMFSRSCDPQYHRKPKLS